MTEKTKKSVEKHCEVLISKARVEFDLNTAVCEEIYDELLDYTLAVVARKWKAEGKANELTFAENVANWKMVNIRRRLVTKSKHDGGDVRDELEDPRPMISQRSWTVRFDVQEATDYMSPILAHVIIFLRRTNGNVEAARKLCAKEFKRDFPRTSFYEKVVPEATALFGEKYFN